MVSSILSSPFAGLNNPLISLVRGGCSVLPVFTALMGLVSTAELTSTPLTPLNPDRFLNGMLKATVCCLSIAIAAAVFSRLYPPTSLDRDLSSSHSRTSILSQAKKEQPIGLPNKNGIDCCFIAALQLLFNIPSWSSLKTLTALNPVIEAYQKASTSDLDLRPVRKQIDIYEEEHWLHQEDPAAYIRALGDQIGKSMVSKKRYFSATEALLLSERESRADEPMLRLGMTSSTTGLTLESLLENYFHEHWQGMVFSKEKDELIETQDGSTCVKTTLVGDPPENLLIQIKRFQKQTPELRSVNVEAISFLQWIIECIRTLLGLQERNKPDIYEVQPRTFKDRKVKDPVATPIHLEMKADYFEGRQTPVHYNCKGFLVHYGDQIRSGHYVAYVFSQGAWYQCNDSIITAVSDAEAQKALQTSYIISYEKVSP